MMSHVQCLNIDALLDALQMPVCLAARAAGETKMGSAVATPYQEQCLTNEQAQAQWTCVAQSCRLVRCRLDYYRRQGMQLQGRQAPPHSMHLQAYTPLSLFE